VIAPSTPQSGGRLASLGPALLGATSFAIADVLSKFALKAGADPLTLSTVRGVLGLATVLAWLQLSERPVPLRPRARWISLGLGVVFAANIFLLFSAFQVVEVPIAILTYFIYPLLTGLVAAATGIDKLTWRGAAAALVAFLGLALMIGAHPAALAVWGIIAALAAACCRVVMLLVTRGALQGVDARLITWYSLVSSTAVLVLVSLATWKLAAAGDHGRLGRLDRGQRRGHDRHPRRVRLDHAHRTVSHGAVHESGAAARDRRQRAPAQ